MSGYEQDSAVFGYTSDDTSEKAIESVIGKEIECVKFITYDYAYMAEGEHGDAKTLVIKFVTGEKLEIWDDGQDCCERRYMTTDDDLDYFKGCTFLDAKVLNAPDRADTGEVHEVQFLVVSTTLGIFTVETHNEHNGYYGGFSVKARIW